jgi:hypothetical protein
MRLSSIRNDPLRKRTCVGVAGRLGGVAHRKMRTSAGSPGVRESALKAKQSRTDSALGK